MIKVRILLSSGPPISAAATILHAGSLQLCSRDSSWLLADYDIVSIYAKVHQLDEEIAATGTKAAAPGDTKWTLNGERIHTDRSHSRVRVADQARLLWRATELLDKAWDIFDINENGQISAKELHALMGALGEKLSAEEIAWMIVECKAWGRRSFPEFRTLLAQHQLEHILPGGGVAHSADQPVIHQQMEFLRLMVEDMELPTCTCPVEHAESEQLCLNVLDERMVITRDEFQIMMSEYWTCRKHTAHSSEMRRGLDRRPPWEEDITDDYTLMKPQVDQWHQAMLNTFHFKNVDHLLDASVNPTNHFLGRQPQWLAGLANDHQLDAVAPRTAHALWFFVRCRVEHILIKKTRAQLKPGAQTKRLKLLDPEALVKQNAPEEKPGADLRDLTRRTVGSPDGKIEASKFSTVWDLLQVFFLLYVLVSVPFAIAFDFQWEVGVPMWWFELVVDTYFVLDLLMYFRTPYFVDGVIHDGTCQMAKNYLCGWFIPDVLSCVSILEYFLDRGLSNMRAARLVRLIKLTKLLKLARLQRLRERQRVLFQEIFDGDMLRKLGAVGSAVKLLLGFCLAVHLVSCTWYFIGAMNSDGWVVDNGWDLPDDVNITGSNSTRPALFRRYMISMTSIMILDPPADSATAEQVFAIFNVLINSFIFGSVAATFTSIIAKLAEPFRVFNSKMAMLRTWMGTKRFTHSTRQTIEMFYAAKLGSANGTVVNETEIMSAFRAAPIEKEVVALMYAKQIKQLPMFQSLTEDLISKLCLQLTQLPALQGMPVVVQGQLAECMYIVNEGRLQNWQTTSNGVLRARCTMHQSSFLPLTSLPDATFWAEAWDSSSWDSSSHNDSIDAIRGQLTLLDVSELKRQCQADGVSDEAWNNAMDRPGISARQGMIDAICEHVAGGTINMNGQESNPALRHRAIIGNISYSATSRHASFDQYPLTVPFRRNFFFKDFDPLEGYSNVRVRAGDSMQVIEVRRGNVLSYLTPGDYFGEVCLLGADNDTSVYYGSNLTAMVDSQICFLNKSDVLKLKEQYPEIERSMEVAVNQRNAALRPRQLFAQAAGADGTVGRNEVRQLLQDLGCHRVEIDTALRSLTGPTLNEQNFESWYITSQTLDLHSPSLQLKEHTPPRYSKILPRR
eukprot:COSAG01_NODE_4111_length_5339_cov_13.132443_1_plen_1129_part_00